MPCKDGHVVLIPGAAGLPRPGGGDEAELSPMALLTENPELDKSPGIASLGDRMINWRAVDEVLEPWLMEHTAKEIVDTAQALRMPFALVPDVKELLESEHLAARGFWTPRGPEANSPPCREERRENASVCRGLDTPPIHSGGRVHG